MSRKHPRNKLVSKRQLQALIVISKALAIANELNKKAIEEREEHAATHEQKSAKVMKSVVDPYRVPYLFKLPTSIETKECQHTIMKACQPRVDDKEMVLY